MSSPDSGFGLWVATIAVVVCTVVVARYPTRPSSLAEILDGARSPTGETALMFRAFAVFQPGDCRGNLEFLRIFQRTAIEQQYTLTGLLLGSAPELQQATSQLERRRIRILLRRVDRRQLEKMGSLGFRETPFVFVIDDVGRVRFATPAPSGHYELARFAAYLQQLAPLQEAP